MSFNKKSLQNFVKNNYLLDVETNESLFNSGIIDSFGLVELIAFLEDENKIIIPHSDITLKNFDTIDLIVKYMSSKTI